MTSRFFTFLVFLSDEEAAVQARHHFGEAASGSSGSVGASDRRSRVRHCKLFVRTRKRFPRAERRQTRTIVPHARLPHWRRVVRLLRTCVTNSFFPTGYTCLFAVDWTMYGRERLITLVGFTPGLDSSKRPFTCELHETLHNVTQVLQ